MPEVKEVIERVSDERLAEHVSVGIGYYHAFKTLSDIETMSVVKEIQRARTILQERDELREALRPFLFGDPTMEQILFGHLPDDATGTFTMKLGDLRRARALSNKGAK